MDGLLGICRQERIHVSYQPLDTAWGLFGMFYRDRQNRPCIALDPSLEVDRAMHRSVLAEEIGHYFTTPTTSACVLHFSYSNAVTLSRDDRRALRWACDYLIPVPDIARAVQKGVRQVDEFADWFDVTPWMVHRRFQFLREDMRTLHGLRVRTRDVLSPILVATAWGYELCDNSHG